MHIFNIRPAHGLVFMLLAGGTVLAAPAGHELLFTNAQNAATLTDDDRRAIYGQLGLKVGKDGKSLAFADSDCPSLLPGTGDIQVQTEELNSDKLPEVFVSLGSTCMFGFAGTGVSLFIKDGTGHWKSHNLGAGVYVVQKTRHQGYADLMIGGPGFCQPVLRWNGKSYVFHHNVAEHPGGCDGQ
jgi:hypothetical protein